MEISVTKDELYTMIKTAVRDVIHEEKMDIILKSIPAVSDEEMNEIEETYGAPEKNIEIAYSEIIDL